jgi:hypothetical protein
MKAQKVTPLRFGCSEDRGFLPKSDPSPLLQWKAGCEDEHIETIRSWQKLARDLPSYILAKKVRKTVSTLAPFPIKKLEHTKENRERLMQALSYAGCSCKPCGPLVRRCKTTAKTSSAFVPFIRGMQLAAFGFVPAYCAG